MDQSLSLIILGQFAEELPPVAPRLSLLNIQPRRISSLEQLPPPQSSREVLLTELRWLDALAPTQREALSKRAAMAAGWIALVDRDSRFKEQVAWQRAGVSHFFHKPLDADRLAALLEDIHDRLDGPPARAILVDDDEHSLSYYSAVLKDAGVEVMALQDPLLVLEAMEDFKPDLLLLDIDMPGCRGTELATIVRQRPEYARLPAIFLTAMEGMQDKLLAREAAAEDYLNKPVALDLLVAAVKSHTLRYRSMQRSDAWRRQQEKQSQEAIRISEERLRRGQSYANIGTWDWNIQTGNLFWSERIPVLFGHPAGELVTTIENLLNALHPGDRQSVLDAINASVERDVPYEIEHRVILPDGTVRWLLEKGAVVRDAAGKPLQMLGVVQDIDDRKRAEQLSVAARKEAEQANQAKSDFLSRMSHELRTPLHAILGFGQLMAYDNTLPEMQKDNLHEILKGGRHLLELINEVLDLAKIESGRIDLSLEPVELAGLIEDCRLLIRPLAALRQIAMRVEVSPRMSVRADRVRLKQVLLNLLSNAVKYNNEGGVIHLSVFPGGVDRLRIAIADTGAGIPPERMPELFQPFSRLNAERSTIEGTGIGLTITRLLVELMGGEVGVDSRVGSGSTFWIELPAETLSNADVTENMSHGAPGTAASGRQYRVLCIDDNPVNLKLVAQMLGMRRHIHLMTAHTPKLGLELALAHLPDMVLLDINMPGMDGYEVLKVFKSDPRLKHIPIVAVTANALPRDIERGMAAGFTDYLTKPLHVTRFVEVIDRMLSHGANAP